MRFAYYPGYLMNIKYTVELTEEEKTELLALTSKGKASARLLKRAYILLMADDQKPSMEIAHTLYVSESTVQRTKQCFVEYGLSEALNEGSRPGAPRKLNPKQEGLLIALACSAPPQGCSRWTLNLLADRFIALTDMDEPVSVETIRRRFKENELKPWQKKMWCVGDMNADYIAQMEHILDLYAQPENPHQPVIHFDEGMKQLVKDIKPTTKVKPGQPAKQDYEYKRVSVANLFVFFDRHQGWRTVKATQSKKAADFAGCMKELVDIHYPSAEKVHVVMDNYGTHKAGSLYQTFEPQEALRIMQRLEFHYTPKHASWLNMVEIEIGNMNQQCLDRRIPSWEKLVTELAAWEKRRNEAKASIKWLFNVDKAREKLNRAYDNLKPS